MASSPNESFSPQVPDYIIYQGDTIVTYNLLLEKYLDEIETEESPKLFGLSFRENSTMNCWRGYQAIYKIDHDSLFLVDIIQFAERSRGINKANSLYKLNALFPGRVRNEKVFMDWHSGDISFPLEFTTLRWDGVFYKIFEKEKLVSVIQGKVQRIEDISNYLDEASRINRRYRDTISRDMFRELSRARWGQKYDCSSTYIITIGQDGRVQKVKYRHFDEDEDEETRFCKKKIAKALKNLRFDIIRDKGKPIEENVYIELWFEDGEIFNWTTFEDRKEWQKKYRTELPTGWYYLRKRIGALRFLDNSTDSFFINPDPIVTFTTSSLWE